jgi:hypothetical protein
MRPTHLQCSSVARGKKRQPKKEKEGREERNNKKGKK